MWIVRLSLRTLKFTWKREFIVTKKRDFTQALAGVDFSMIYSVQGTQRSFDLFHGKLLTLLNKYFPKIRIKKKYNNRKPWLTDGMRKSIKHKNKLYYNYRKIKSVHNEVLYKSYKYHLQKLLQAAEKQYYHGLFVQYRNDMNKSWGIMKNIINKNKAPTFQSAFKLNNGSIISDKKTVSQHFNDFFIYVGPTLARNIPNVGKLPKDFLVQMVEESLFLNPVTVGEINKLIAGLKNTATGYDDISAALLILSLEYIADPLVHICNSSMIEGVFPEQLKIACVLPLYKAEDPMYFNHYRPVSLLTILSKVFERLMYVRLQNLPWSKTGLVSKQVLHPLSKLQNWIWSKTGRYKTGLVSNTKIEASLRATKSKPWQLNLTSDTVEIFIQNEKAGLVPMQSRFRSRHKAGFVAAGLGTAQSWFWSRHKASFGAVSRPV